MLHFALVLALSNPFFTPSTLPFGAFPFDKITDADYQPAIEEGMKRQQREIDAIANNPAAPTFQNTFVAMEKSGRMLTYVLSAFNAVTGANIDETLQRVDEVEGPKLAAFQDGMYQNAKLFARVKSVYDRLPTLHLDSESQQLVRVTYQQFVHAGANLSPANKAKLSQLDQQLSTLRSTFSRKLLAAAKAAALVVSDKTQLAGMSDNAVAAAAAAAQSRNLTGSYVIGLQSPTQQPALQTLENRTVRQTLFDHSWTRAEKGDANDTRDTVATIAKLRAQKAQLLGYRTYADYVLTDEMAKTPQAVQNFLGQIIPPARAKIKAEAAEIQAQINKNAANQFALQPWDWSYYSDQVRRDKYQLDDKEVRPYFELNNMLQNGLFYVANQLYGITFKERHDIPVYNSDVRVFDVFDKNGAPLALMYFDFFKRDNKQGGAWMDNFVQQSRLLGTKPVVYNVENIPKPPAGQPVLLTANEVHGIFHEFGHALNGFFASGEYPSLSGAQTARDFVEYPSQFNEHWAFYPAVLKHYAIHYQTHEPMPDSLMKKVQDSQTFGGGYGLGESLAADELDMAWHTLPASAPKQDVDAFEKQALASSGTDFPNVPPRYRSSYFAHIFQSGYAAGYYAYMWSEMLDDDTWAWFQSHGGMTRANGQRFRDLILSKGHSMEYGPMFRAFYGKDPEIGPLLENRGLPTPKG